MNAGQKTDRNEFVLDLPDQVWKKDKQRQSRTGPQPSAAEVTASRCGQHTEREAGHRKDHCVFRQHPEGDHDGNTDPPARVIGIEKANDGVCNRRDNRRRRIERGDRPRDRSVRSQQRQPRQAAPSVCRPIPRRSIRQPVRKLHWQRQQRSEILVMMSRITPAPAFRQKASPAGKQRNPKPGVSHHPG
jgi:hypothetical protein